MGFTFCRPIDTDDGDFDSLLRAVERLALNDAAIEWEREQSPALGMGLRMGFLGVLHMEVRTPPRLTVDESGGPVEIIRGRLHQSNICSTRWGVSRRTQR